MSIASDTQRIKSAKAAIQAAIEGKGVTVPDGTLLDGMAELIAGIEAGGGSTEPYAKIITGTHTPANNEASITFLQDNNLVLRYFIMQVADYSTDSKGSNIINKMCVFRDYPQVSRVLYSANAHWSMPNNKGSNTDILVFPGNSSTKLYLGAGTTYNWIAVYTDV